MVVLASGFAWFAWSRPSKWVAADLFDGARFVEDIRLVDREGKTHTTSEWRRHSAVILVFLDRGDARSIVEVVRSRDDVGLYAIATGADSDRPASGLPVWVDAESQLVDAIGLGAGESVAVLDPEGLVVDRGGPEILAWAIKAADLGRPVVRADRAETAASGPATRTSSGGDGPVTYAEHVAPILRDHCVECHRPGEVAPFSLTTYRDASKRSAFLAEVAESRQMPPWKAQPGFGRFLDPHHLTARELATLRRWSETGAAEGRPAPVDSVETPVSGDGWKLGPPDLVLAMEEDYPVAATGDVFRGFVLPGNLGEGRSIAAVEFRPGNRKVVHHARIFLDPTGAYRRIDGETAELGFPYDPRADVPRASLGEWNPGVMPRPPIDGVARPSKPGSEVLLVVHYHGSGKPELDRSSVAIYFAKGPARRIMAMHPLASDRIDIPAGEASHREIARTTLFHDVHAYSVLPHGHKLLSEMKFTATLPDGQIRRLLWVRDWDMDWQGQYHFAEPIALPKGTRLEVVAIYDNSASNPANPHSPPRRVKYGPGSDEEMLGCHLYLVADSDAGDLAYRAKWESGR